MPTLSVDTVIRADQSGLGTSSGGESYTVNGSLTAAIASNEAVITGSGGFTSAILGTQTTADIEFWIRVEQNHNIFDGVGFCFRSDASGNNCYFVALYDGLLLFSKLTGGGFAGIASASVTDNLNTFYWIHGKMIGNHLQARIWADGGSEPGAWDVDTTDSTYTAAGHYGPSFNAFAGGSDTVKFDHITVTDGVSSTTVDKKFVTRFFQFAVAQKKFVSRLSQYAIATKSFRSRFSQFAVSQKKFTSRFSHVAIAAKAFRSRVSQYATTGKTFATRFSQVLRAPKKFVSRFRQYGIGTKKFRTRFHHGITIEAPGAIHVLWKTRSGHTTWLTRTGHTIWRTRS